MEMFRDKFKDSASVLTYFAPAKWAGAASNPNNSMYYPNVSLRMLDDVYGKGTAQLMCKGNLRGIFMLAEPREPVNEQAMAMTSEMLVSKHGAEVSVFGMFYYFAVYLTDYKGSYGRFDLQDVIRQLGKAFLPWWRSRLGRMEDGNKMAQKQSGLQGKEAMMAYLRREYVEKGRDIRESALYDHGYISDGEIERIKRGETTF